jgi:hypothetical protein
MVYNQDYWLIKINMKNINFKKIILALGIVISLNLFFNMGIDAFYRAPKYEDTCSNSYISYYTKDSCEAAEGFWVPNTVDYGYKGEVPAGKQVAPTAPITSQPCDATGRTDCIQDTGYHCDMSQYQNKCQAAFTATMNDYNRVVFIVLVILGVASLIGGFFFSKSGAVSLGLSFGGLTSLLIGTIRYWSSMEDFLRFAVSGVALVVLIWFGVKKFGDNHEEENKNAGV